MIPMTYDSLVADLEDYLDRSDARLIAQIPNFISLAEIRCAREIKNLGFKTSVVSVMQPGNYVYIKPNRWLETISINYGTSTPYATTSRQNASGTRTLTLSKAHDFAVGDSVSVFNVGGTNYNGNFTISAVTQYTISYLSGSGTEAATSDSDGVVTAPLEERVSILPRSYEFCNNYWPNRTSTGAPKFYADYDYENWLIVPTPDIAYPFEVVYFEKPMPLSSTNQTNWLTDYARDLLLYASLLETASYLKDDKRIPVWKDYYMQAATALKTENNQRKNDASIKRQE